MLERLLVTGAAGGLARMIRPELGRLALALRLSDIAAAPAGETAEWVRCDLGDADAVDGLVEGCDGILHLGGISTENSFGRILNANIVGVHNLYEAARRHGRPRIFFASSNHVVGFYRQDERIDTDAPHRPDGWYGVSKSFGEAVALMYFHKFGQESALVRIGSCFAEPKDHRMLATWFAPEDFVALAECVFAVPRLGCPVVYGVSDNDASWWDNAGAAHLGWRPRHNAAAFAGKIAASVPLPDKDDPRAVYQGGAFTAEPIHEE
ncbi:NAD(P)-dependent oxidoreductase [Limibaculum sp. FT325]|uniref:NAD-dependent epimerase/dehydratase family protein n=1 Tax=Thermohalobaculum sediminis TaxID=2939436 RepID=UPI0020C132A0|nr:NAD(P)-dependent oxidoreductase [Limibaculum sediminis]MCL5778096.1 NAD(P)-dependent oxidoreductase [Limibaculum sediminis]